ncbi:uncharacterized protein TERG_02245 [Trichophyton rubrum CBS 118892]|uniref:Uncharacterized protein n=1 Tax=Trichophyton rubrum (strain ATCC MYA-4607 / CBS 118892) TaxID=559305 RepID=F2SGC2_TRIRC|nr:uncharacterized protein TERG_02245 [Trichophyton rubrum CBS 118892]EGD85978.1 hypothetical protein TERG_02245 [Trichophyton rubrum CBS 118892]KMQ48482.1 hypothetical protein HL42_0651 [Trichophyton rubrum]
MANKLPKNVSAKGKIIVRLRRVIHPRDKGGRNSRRRRFRSEICKFAFERAKASANIPFVTPCEATAIVVAVYSLRKAMEVFDGTMICE